MESVNTYWQDRALLEWQIELGASEAIQDTPVDRYALDPVTPKVKAEAPVDAPKIVQKQKVDPVAVAETAARSAENLDQLKAAMAAFEHCELRRGAKNLVFADGRPDSRVMIIGEAPGRHEDIAGKPFVGQAGQLLDKMFAAIVR